MNKSHVSRWLSFGKYWNIIHNLEWVFQEDRKNMSEDILTIRDVAEFLKVTEKTVYSLAQKRKIPGFKVGGQWRFRREDLDAWIARQTADDTGNEEDGEN
jgi:excisionase family DNA binding protein